MSAIDDYLEFHARDTTPFTKGDLDARPVQRTAVVTCMDSRILAVRLLGIDEGDAHIIRNAGGVVTDDVIRSLMLSQRVLGTREVMLIQHTGCGLFTSEGEALRASLEAASGGAASLRAARVRGPGGEPSLVPRANPLEPLPGVHRRGARVRV
jgi:carbonic anhydrase